MADPSVLIKTHIPFDPLWQFLYYPVTHLEFDKGWVHQNTTKPYFNYPDSILVFEKQAPLQQWISAANRIEQNGTANSLVSDRLKYYKVEIEHYRHTQIIDLFNAAVVAYNQSASFFNDFVGYKNDRFIPLKSDPEIQSMIDVVTDKLNESKHFISQIHKPDPTIAGQINNLQTALEETTRMVAEQNDWLQAYFSKNKVARKAMFIKITWGEG